MLIQVFSVYFTAILGSFLLSTALVPLIIDFAKKYGILDRPEAASRKIHFAPIPFLGGWAIFLSSTVIIILMRYFQLADFSRLPWPLFIGIIIAGLVIMIGGSLDDKFNLKPWQQIIFPISAVIIALIFGLKIGFVTNPLSAGGVLLVPQLLGIALVVLWLLGMMYATKFLDGLDGLVSGIGVIAAAFIFLISLKWDLALSATGVWSLAIMGACLGFWFYNRSPAKIFLGEGGSVFVGFILGVLSVVTGSKITTTLLVMGFPFLDVLMVVVLRLINKQSPFKGDRRHLHYRLLDAGFQPIQAVWLLYIVAFIFGALSLMSSSWLKVVLVAVMLLLMLAISWFLQTKNSGK
jgi:UDP-GlcNAc:undecaprenyl-phosphate/decaprenyl-phosphate GlcNAc-1-phosphate transferase